jgi:hypothetical protein
MANASRLTADDAAMEGVERSMRRISGAGEEAAPPEGDGPADRGGPEQ